ncbi:hypothetical protein ACOJR9_11065 [Alteromonas sp. A081]|uniref:hypothetical protein n=1 Tax=Alteromonas sp. A081 TaxID=3410269 RepID=UPI003B97F354
MLFIVIVGMSKKESEGVMQGKNKYANVKVLMGLGTALVALAGCANSDSSAYVGALDRATCIRLLAYGVDCQNENYLVSDARAHAEFFQQELPIHQRQDVINGEIEATQRNK